MITCNFDDGAPENVVLKESTAHESRHCRYLPRVQAVGHCFIPCIWRKFIFVRAKNASIVLKDIITNKIKAPPQQEVTNYAWVYHLFTSVYYMFKFSKNTSSPTPYLMNDITYTEIQRSEERSQWSNCTSSICIISL